MEYRKIEIKKGINLHLINTEKFKTNLLSVFITTKLAKETVTKNALIPMILKRGSKNMPTSEKISENLEEMYGADFNCGVEKTGDNQVLKFYLETLNDEYLPEKEYLLEKSIATILELIFDPYTEDENFKEEYVNGEKENLKQIIEGKKDSKDRYAYERCIEEMYKDQPYGLYKYGYIEELEKIDNKNLYEYYKKMIKESKIDIFLSGKIEEDAETIIKENENIKKLDSREYEIIITDNNNQNKQVKEITENTQISQGKLVIGLDVKVENKKQKYAALLYNAILGGTPTSKMFQNVREKESLAYTAASNYIRNKDIILVRCGIEIENYDKALELTKKQIEDMKNGEFSEENIQNAKANIISNIRAIPDEQDTQITYYFGQEFSKYKMNFDEYEEQIKNLNKQDVREIAQNVTLNTIYFLKS